MCQRRYSMRWMCTSYRSRSCSDAFWQCKHTIAASLKQKSHKNCRNTRIGRNALGYKIVGYPVQIHNQRYARNAFYFNLCFVCDSWARTIQYEPVVKKLSEYFVSAPIKSQSNTCAFTEFNEFALADNDGRRISVFVARRQKWHIQSTQQCVARPEWP